MRRVCMAETCAWIWSCPRLTSDQRRPRGYIQSGRRAPKKLDDSSHSSLRSAGMPGNIVRYLIFNRCSGLHHQVAVLRGSRWENTWDNRFWPATDARLLANGNILDAASAARGIECFLMALLPHTRTGTGHGHGRPRANRSEAAIHLEGDCRYQRGSGALIEQLLRADTLIAPVRGFQGSSERSMVTPSARSGRRSRSRCLVMASCRSGKMSWHTRRRVCLMWQAPDRRTS